MRADDGAERDRGPTPDGVGLLALYDRALPQVYGYLRPRVGGDDSLAEDLTAEVFLAAVSALDRGTVPDLTVAWLVAVARNKLVDHWRRAEVEQRSLRLVDAGEDEAVEDDLDAPFERTRARAVLAGLAPQNRAALTLRYLDGLAVPEVADALGRTVGATEVLLVRARKAFRAAYDAGEPTAPGRGER